MKTNCVLLTILLLVFSATVKAECDSLPTVALSPSQQSGDLGVYTNFTLSITNNDDPQNCSGAEYYFVSELTPTGGCCGGFPMQVNKFVLAGQTSQVNVPLNGIVYSVNPPPEYLPPKTYALKFRCTYTNCESNTVTYNMLKPQIDLSVDSLYWYCEDQYGVNNGQTCFENDRVKFEWTTVSNKGTSVSSEYFSCWVSFRLDGTEVSGANFGTLAQGQSQTITSGYTSSVLSQGSHSVSAKWFCHGFGFQDTNSNNDELLYPISVSAPEPCFDSDGINPAVKGYVKNYLDGSGINRNPIWDLCSMDGTVLNEMYCQDSHHYSIKCSVAAILS